MVQMATPWQHPDTRAYYIRRQIPEALRPAFGGKSLYKASLRTKNPIDAARLFAQANAAFEAQLEEARQRLAATGYAGPSPRDRATELVRAYFEGPAISEGGLDGPERLVLTCFEVGAGARPAAPLDPVTKTIGFRAFNASSPERWWELASNAALFRDYWPTKRFREGKLTLAALCDDLASCASELRQEQASRVVEQIRRHHGLTQIELPDGIEDVVLEYLYKMRQENEVAGRKPRSATPRLRPEMRLSELFDEWKDKRKPTPKTAHEYRRAVNGFIDYIGDIPVSEITQDDLLNYRDAVAAMPKHLPRADCELTFSERHAMYAGSDKPKISVTTLKKQVGGVQAMLSFAKGNNWIKTNVGAGLTIEGEDNGGGASRRSFLASELQLLFSTPLFTQPKAWRITNDGISDLTMFWLFLIGATSGARLEEIGQAALVDVRNDGPEVTYIDIDDYVIEPDGTKKTVKTDESRRVVPLHTIVMEAGMLKYVSALRAAGHRELFPDLVPNKFGNRTQGASQKANRIIDRYISKDRRIVFHSFRHTFKQLGAVAGVSERILDELCGHAPTSVARRYGADHPLWALARALAQIDFSFIEVQNVIKAFKDFDWGVAVAKLPVPASRRPA